MFSVKKLTRALSVGVFFLFSTTQFVYAQSVQTALGPIDATPPGIANWVLRTALRLAGGVAFLLMLYGGFLFLTSAGDPNKVQEATEIIVSAIAGLLMIIFSVFLLNLIGVKILLL